MTDEELDRMEGRCYRLDDRRITEAEVFVHRLVAEVRRLQKERDEAIAHRDDYETMCIEQGIEIRKLKERKCDGA